MNYKLMLETAEKKYDTEPTQWAHLVPSKEQDFTPSPQRRSASVCPSHPPIHPNKDLEVFSLTQRVVDMASGNDYHSDAPSVVDLLNTLDSVVASAAKRPDSSVINEVYRNILAQERHKAKDSIAAIANQISQLQDEQRSPDVHLQTAHFASTESEDPPSWVLERQQRPLGLSGPCARATSSFLNEPIGKTRKSQTQNLSFERKQTGISSASSFKLRPPSAQVIKLFTLTGPQLLDEVLNLQKHSSFLARCQRLELHLKKPATERQNVLKSLRASKLPVFSVEAPSEETGSSSSDETLFATSRTQKAIDSYRTLVVAYCVRKLLTKVIRGLQATVLSGKQRKFRANLAGSHHSSKLLDKAFASLQIYQQVHKGHKEQNVIARYYWQQIALKKSIGLWRRNFLQIKQEQCAVQAAASQLNFLQVRRFFMAFVSQTKFHRLIRLKLAKATRTRQYILALRCLRTLKGFVLFKKRCRHLDNTANRFRYVQFGRKALAALLIHKKRVVLRYYQHRMSADFYRCRLVKLGFFSILRFCISTRSKRLREMKASWRSDLSLKQKVVLGFRTSATCAKQKRNKIKLVDALRRRQQQLRIIGFLHASNLEFIRRAVLAEEYLKRRKAKFYLAGLRVYAQGKCLNMLNMASDFQLYSLSLWVGPFRFAVSTRAHRVRKQHQFEERLRTTIKSQVWQKWSQTAKTQVAFKRKLLQRHTKEVFEWLGAWSLRKKRIRVAAERLETRSRHQTLLKILHGLQLHAASYRSKKSNLAVLSRLHKASTQRRHFQAWLSLFQRIDSRRKQRALAADLGKKKHLKAFITVWQSAFALSGRKRALAVRLATFQKQKFVQSTFTHWNRLLHAQIQESQLELFITQRHQKKICSAFWEKLAAETRATRLLNFSLDRYAQQKNLACQGQVFHAMCEQARLSKVKETLFQQLSEDRAYKLERLCWDALRFFPQFKREQSERDRVLTQVVHARRLQKLFAPWKRRAAAKTALRQLAHVWPRLQLQCAFKRIHRHGETQLEKVDGFVGLKLCSRGALAFRSLKAYARRKETRQNRIAYVRSRCHFHLQNQAFQEWKRIHLAQVANENTVKRLILENAFVLKSKVFRTLSRYVQVERVLVTYLERRQQQRLTNAFKVLSWHSDLHRRALLVCQRRVVWRKYGALRQWTRRIEAELRVRRVQAIIATKTKTNCLLAWRYHRWQKETLDSQCGRLRHKQETRLKNQILAALFQNVDAVRTLQLQRVAFGAKIRTNFFKACFEGWRQRAVVHSPYTQREKQISLSHNKAVVGAALEQWFKQCHSRILKYKSLSALPQILARQQQCKALKVWQSSVLLERHLEELLAHWQAEKKQYSKTQTLAILSNYASRSIANKDRRRTVAAYLRRRRLVLAFARVSSFVFQQRISRTNKAKAAKSRHESLAALVLQALLQNKIRRQQAQFLIQKATRLRVVPRAFVSLKMFTHSRRHGRALKNRAKQQRCVMLAMRAFQSFAGYHLHRVHQARAKQFADLFFARKNLPRYLTLFRMGINKVKILKTKHGILAQAIESVDAQCKLQHAFAYLQLAVLRSQQKGLKVQLIDRRNTQRRVVQSWRSLVTRRSELLVQAHSVQQRRELSIKGRALRLWLVAQQHQLKVVHLQVRHGAALRERAFHVLALNVQHAYFRRNADALYFENVRRKSFEVLLQHCLSMQRQREVEAEIQLALSEKTMTRCLLALKYNALINKGERLLSKKRNSKLKFKALDALKYNGAQGRLAKQFFVLRQRRLAFKTLDTWFQRMVSKQETRRYFGPAIKSYIVRRKKQAFYAWKRRSFFGRALELIDAYIVKPDQEHTLKRVILAWRKYSYLQRHVKGFALAMKTSQERKTKQKHLAAWYALLTQRLPVKVLAQRLEAFSTRTRLRIGFEAVNAMANYRSDFYEKATYLHEAREQSAIKTTFVAWKKRLDQLQKESIVVKRHERTAKKITLITWYNSYLNHKKEAKDDVRLGNLEARASRCFELKKKAAFLGALRAQTVSRYTKQAATIHWQRRKASHVLEQWFLVASAQGKRRTKQRQLVAVFMYGRTAKGLQQKTFDRWKQLTACRQAESYEREEQTRNLAEQDAEVTSSQHPDNHASSSLDTTQGEEEEELGIQSSRLQKICIQSHLEREVVALRDITLKTKVFKAIVKLAHRTKATNRSRLYTIFSAWKLHTREKSLLKRYLFECRDSQYRSLSTQQLNDSQEVAASIHRSKGDYNLSGSIISEIYDRHEVNESSDVVLRQELVGQFNK